jgi:chromosome segregation ATPase
MSDQAASRLRAYPAEQVDAAIASLKATVAAARADAESARHELAMAQAGPPGGSTEVLSAAHADLSQALAEADHLRREVVSARGDADVARSALDAARADAERVRGELADVYADVAAARSAQEFVSAEAERLRSDAASLRAVHEAALDDADLARREALSLREELELLRSSEAQGQGQLAELQRRIDDTQQLLAELQGTREALRSRVIEVAQQLLSYADGPESATPPPPPSDATIDEARDQGAREQDARDHNRFNEMQPRFDESMQDFLSTGVDAQARAFLGITDE